MMSLFRSLMARWRDSSTGKARRSAAGRPHYRQARLEQCEERAVLSASGTDLVTALYSDILNRAPDQAGLHTYNSLLQGGESPAIVAQAIWNSPEHRGIQVDGLYQTLLHRTANPEERQISIQRMESGWSEENVMSVLVGSPEYIQQHTVGQSYITALYYDVLGRSPDSDGLTSWTNVLANLQIVTIFGETAQEARATYVANAFVYSHEHQLQLVDSYYADFLHRAADSVGEADWVQMLDNSQISHANDETVALAFLSSQEYLNLHPRTPLS
jgi:hypothetical protein